MGPWSEWHYTTRYIGGWIHNHEPVTTGDYVSIHQSPSCVMSLRSQDKWLLAFISYLWCELKHLHISWLPLRFESPVRTAVALAAIFMVAKSSRCVNDLMDNWKVKSWTVTRVTVTTMPMMCTDVHSGVPMSHFLNRQVGMGCQALNSRSRTNCVFKMSRMHACL